MQRVVANCTSRCEPRMVAETARAGFFLKIGICIDDETWEKD